MIEETNIVDLTGLTCTQEKIFKRIELSSTKILQECNAMRGRYGL